MSVWLVLVIVAAALVGLFGLTATLWFLISRTDQERIALARRISRLSLRNKARLAVALFRDGRVPIALRAVPAFLVFYLAMPLDLIPDFIPVVGYLDDVLIVGLGVGLLLRFTPREALDDQIARIERENA